MADIGTPKNWLVTSDYEVQQKWKEAAIQEKISRRRALQLRIQGLTQQIEDIQKKEIVVCEADIMMLDKEIAFLKSKKTDSEIVDAETV